LSSLTARWCSSVRWQLPTSTSPPSGSTRGGAVDSSFGNGGTVTANLGVGTDSAFGVTVQADGKLVLAGQSANSAGANDFSLIRLR
jgi:hypothetical protein